MNLSKENKIYYILITSQDYLNKIIILLIENFSKSLTGFYKNKNRKKTGFCRNGFLADIFSPRQEYLALVFQKSCFPSPYVIQHSKSVHTCIGPSPVLATLWLAAHFVTWEKRGWECLETGLPRNLFRLEMCPLDYQLHLRNRNAEPVPGTKPEFILVTSKSTGAFVFIFKIQF